MIRSIFLIFIIVIVISMFHENTCSAQSLSENISKHASGGVIF